MKSQVYLFTSPTCPHCPAAKDFIEKFSEERDDFDYEVLSSFDNYGRAMAQEFEVRAVPTFIIKGPKYDKNIGIVGSPTKEKFHELIDLSQGIVKEKKRKEFKIGKFKFKF